MTPVVFGAGAFGTALAVALAANGRVVLVARDVAWVEARENPRLPGVVVPETVEIRPDLPDANGALAPVLLAVPMQRLGEALGQNAHRLDGRALVACCKGVDLATLQGPAALIAARCPRSLPAILTGPSFAADIARGLPTALTLACHDETFGARLQEALSTPALRLYLSTDVIGAELGGAMKNVIAIAAGIVTGAGLGDSARAALIARGHAEMVRLAVAFGAQAETLAGLSGLGDLVLTCTSEGSRNYRHGFALGRGLPVDPAATVEGVPTAQALVARARKAGLEAMSPLISMVAAVTAGQIGIAEATRALMSRPLKKE